MGLFSSKFAKLEAFASAKAEERTPDMLKAAQAELDAAGAKLIMVPHSEGIASAEDLDKHIDSLKTAATAAKKEAETATTAATAAQEALTALKGERVLGSDKVSSDKGKGGDAAGAPAVDPEAAVHDPELPWNAMADRMGLGAQKEEKKPEAPKA